MCYDSASGATYPQHQWRYGRCGRCYAFIPGMTKEDKADAAAQRGDSDAGELATRSPQHVEAARRDRRGK